MLGPRGVALIPGAMLQTRNSDVHFPFRQDSDFWYLTGYDEPDALLVLVPGRPQGEAVLFCRDRDRERERWDGPRVGLERAITEYGFDDAFPIGDADEVVPGLLEGREKVYYNLGRQPAFDQRVIGWVQRLHQGRRHSLPPEELVSLTHTLHEQRLLKSKSEIKAMHQAGRMAAAAHIQLMRQVRANMNEAELSASLLFDFHRQGSAPSYLPIVGAGDNACVLHYIANNQTMRDGDLVLVDAGCEWEYYASDITRCFPVNGRFSAAQQALYEVVLEAQAAAIAKAMPGHAWSELHEAAVAVICQGLLDLGLIQGDYQECLETGAYKRFFMHKTGHWLGLDVHDVGDYQVDGESRTLEAGMVLTVEPGIYVPADCTSVDERWRGIGIRIEDDVAITRQGQQILTEDAPKAIAEIEALMQRRTVSGGVAAA